MAASTVVALGLFSGEWPTRRSPPNVRPYRLTIPRLTPLSSKKTRWSVGRFFPLYTFCLHIGDALFRGVGALLFHAVSKFDDRFADGFLANIRLKRLLDLSDVKSGCFWTSASIASMSCCVSLTLRPRWLTCRSALSARSICWRNRYTVHRLTEKSCAVCLALWSFANACTNSFRDSLWSVYLSRVDSLAPFFTIFCCEEFVYFPSQNRICGFPSSGSSSNLQQWPSFWK